MNDFTNEYTYMLNEPKDIKRIMDTPKLNSDLKYLPFINDEDIKEEKIIGSLILIATRKPYLGFFGFTQVVGVIKKGINEKNDLLYNKLLNVYKVCELINLYFLKYEKIFVFKKIMNKDIYLKDFNYYSNEKYKMKQIKFPRELTNFNLMKMNCNQIIEIIYEINIGIVNKKYQKKKLIQLFENLEEFDDSSSDNISNFSNNSKVSGISLVSTKPAVKSTDSSTLKKDIRKITENLQIAYNKNSVLSDSSDSDDNFALRKFKKKKETKSKVIVKSNDSGSESDNFINSDYTDKYLNTKNKIKVISDSDSDKEVNLKLKSKLEKNYNYNKDDNDDNEDNDDNNNQSKQVNQIKKVSEENKKTNGYFKNYNPEIQKLYNQNSKLFDNSSGSSNGSKSKGKNFEPEITKGNLSNFEKLCLVNRLNNVKLLKDKKTEENEDNFKNVTNSINEKDDYDEEEDLRLLKGEEPEEVEVEEVNFKFDNKENSNDVKMGIPILWIPCEEFGNILSNGKGVTKTLFNTHYDNCSECEIVNNNKKDIINKNSKTKILMKDEEDEEEMSEIIRYYKFCKKYIIPNKEFKKYEADKNTNVILHYSNQEEKTYNNCIFILYCE